MKKIGGYITNETLEFIVHLLIIALATLMLFFVLKPFDLKKGVVHYDGEYIATITRYYERSSFRGGRWYYVYFTISEFGDYEFEIQDSKLYMNSDYGDTIKIYCNDLSLLPNKDGTFTVISYDFVFKGW